MNVNECGAPFSEQVITLLAVALNYYVKALALTAAGPHVVSFAFGFVLAFALTRATRKH